METFYFQILIAKTTRTSAAKQTRCVDRRSEYVDVNAASRAMTVLPLQEREDEKLVDASYSEQADHPLHAIILAQQLELEQLLQTAENLKNDIIRLHNQEVELIQRLTRLKQSQTSVFSDIYALVSNKNVLLFGRTMRVRRNEYLPSVRCPSSFWLSHGFLHSSCAQ